MKLKIKNRVLFWQLVSLTALCVFFFIGTVYSVATGASTYIWLIVPFVFIGCVAFTVVWDFNNIFEISHKNVKTEEPNSLDKPETKA